MRVDSHSGVRGTLYADYGYGEAPVPAPIWFDLETGEFEAFRVTSRWAPFQPGNRQHIVRINGVPQRWIGKARLRFQEHQVEGRLAATVLAERTEPIKRRTPTRILYDPRRRCEGYACDRPASWGVTEELEELPQEVGGIKFERASMLRVRYWCDWCYEPPRILDDKGEVITTYDEIAARPT